MNDKKQTTAITELMEVVEIDFNNGVNISMGFFYGMLKKALAKEREQIEQAFEEGYLTGYSGESNDGKDYYTETFK